MHFVFWGRLWLWEVRKDGKQDAKSQQKIKDVKVLQVEHIARTQLLEYNSEKLIINSHSLQHTLIYLKIANIIT